MPDAFEHMVEALTKAGQNPVSGGPASTEDYIKFFSQTAPHPSDQFTNILRYREGRDREAARLGMPRDLSLRNAEHAFVTQQSMYGGRLDNEGTGNKLSTPINTPAGAVGKSYYWFGGGAPIAAAQVPAYSLWKLLGQKTGMWSQNSTPPSWDEVKWGLAPFWGGMPVTDAVQRQPSTVPLTSILSALGRRQDAD